MYMAARRDLGSGVVGHRAARLADRSEDRRGAIGFSRRS
jgi:hypothetical protein